MQLSLESLALGTASCPMLPTAALCGLSCVRTTVCYYINFRNVLCYSELLEKEREALRD